MKNELHLERKDKFGQTRLYAKCEKAKLFERLMQMNKKIFSDEAISILKQLGFQIYVHNVYRKTKKSSLCEVISFPPGSQEK